MVALQFSFTNADAVPPSVMRLERETLDERSERKSYATGFLVIEPTEKCSIVDFLGDLESAGYELVGAFYKERIDGKDLRGKRTYHMVRFLFTQKEFARPSEEFQSVRNTILEELKVVCQCAFWRVRMFSNPFYQNHEEVPGQRTLSLNFEARLPLTLPNGEPVTAWRKDERGRKMGDAPLPLMPNRHLQIVDGVVLLTA